MILSLVCVIIALLADLGFSVPDSAISPSPAPKADNIVAIDEKIIDFGERIAHLHHEREKARNYTRQYRKRYDDNPISSESRDYEDNIIEEIHIKERDLLPSEPIFAPKIELDAHAKPKIVIIIDDISTKRQLDEMRKIGLNLTPSAFPVAAHNTEMIESLQKLDFFMIHLPLEAKYYNDELDTIKLSDTTESIEAKILHIKSTTPAVKYINNHTGSKFTSSKADMERLLGILDNHHIKFVDSRTSAETMVNQIASEQGRVILHRDIFIDNNLDESGLRAQITQGVKLAKARGYAILIAHPHKETFRALRHAAKDILKDVDVIYLNELDSILQNAHIKQYAQKIPQQSR